MVCADSKRSKFGDNFYIEITDPKLPYAHILAYIYDPHCSQKTVTYSKLVEMVTWWLCLDIHLRVGVETCRAKGSLDEQGHDENMGSWRCCWGTAGPQEQPCQSLPIYSTGSSTGKWTKCHLDNIVWPVLVTKLHHPGTTETTEPFWAFRSPNQIETWKDKTYSATVYESWYCSRNVNVEMVEGAIEQWCCFSTQDLACKAHPPSWSPCRVQPAPRPTSSPCPLHVVFTHPG